MRKILTIIALAILTVGLIVGGIVCFVNLDWVKTINADYPDFDLVKQSGGLLGLGIAMFLGGIASGIYTIASFFKMKVRDAD